MDIVIFRHNLFKISEPFITQQAQQLQRYRPLYMGRLRYGDAPPGAEVLTLQDANPRRALWPLVAWHMVSRTPAPFLKLLGKRRPALIHAHFGVEGVYALPIAHALGIPLVTTFHGFDATLSMAALLCSPAWVNYPLFRPRLARQGQLFLCASGFIRDRLLAMGFPPERTHVHYIGVDSAAITPRDPAEETPTILHIARLVEVKGTEYLLRAFALLGPAHSTARLMIIGDGPLRAHLHKLAYSLGIADRVQFLGALPHPQVISHLRQAAMLVLCSVRTQTGREEGLGMVMLEAAASAVPVIGSDVGGIPEAIIDGQTGFLAPERDPQALARHMQTLLEDPERRYRMGTQARAMVADRFNLHRQTEKLEQFYDSLTGAGHVAD